MKLSVIVPYSPDGGWRDRAWVWLQRRYAMTLPDAEICVGAPDVVGEPGLFNRPQAYNRAFEKATGDVVMLADCDTAFAPQWVTEACAIAATERTWVLPRMYVKLTEDYTEHILASRADIGLEPAPHEWGGQSWSGLVVMSRQALETVGGGDERHRGWGWDDICLGLALDTLWGPHTRLSGYAYHLWHPTPLGDNFGQIHTHDQRALTRRYEAAAGNPERMRLLIGECVR